MLLVLLFTIAYVYSLHVAPWLAKQFPRSRLNTLHEQCIAPRDQLPKWVLGARGGNYIIGGPSASEKLGDCVLTFWGMSHFILYFFIGLLCPDKGILANSVGALFEIYEWIVYDCADPLDVVWNGAGFLLGQAITL